MSSFSPWGGMGGLGEACEKSGVKPTTLGAHAPTRGASPKRSPQKLSSFVATNIRFSSVRLCD